MTTLHPDEAQALLAALDDEYHAHATYTQVLTDFGPVLPFANIVESEARHIQALLQLFERYALAVPPNTWPGRVPRYPDLLAACEAAVSAEVENAALYERLLAVIRHDDLREVLTALRDASQERHLPAFQRCVTRGGAGRGNRGGGQGQGGGRGRCR
ncbi:MAG TPA: DUF2202 domain-containing protein [Pseudomonadaceae bacterium]|nr:DUF2202 domain-containing protein [Pseudomonadaceae bacterium]